ncbi:uncharacterized protein LOC141695065 [Apium graveolens]|uniref:uncharacterized protein LOC141695065 n=1 Tax=Apium graveolens TaxID=4045 RepID=UPI003D7BD81B
MAKEKSKQATLLIFTLITGLLSQSLVIPVVSTESFGDKKCCNDPHGGGSHHTPSHGSGGSHHGRPSHGHGHRSSPSNCGTPPSGGHYDPAPPTTGGSPPYTDTPSTPSTPTYGSPPSSPSIDPGTPSTPTYGSPPTSPSIDPGTPATPIDPATPGSPTLPVTPTIPGVSSPPPFSFNPNSPPFPCTYWINHPTLIWGLFGFYGTTLGGAFGLTSNGAPAAGASQVSLEQALSNTHMDGIGALYREGTAALLNSMVIRRFPFTTEQVRDRFVSALASNKEASAQARVFKMANEGRLKPRN